ncbi:hypothetical protein HYW18_01675 [Candidatus Uhrbacteria bacterium]|nr:hypothetical protein [Candidatus Uhrbacteria bacterium]
MPVTPEASSSVPQKPESALGGVHVLPKEYQGGKIPPGSSLTPKALIHQAPKVSLSLPPQKPQIPVKPKVSGPTHRRHVRLIVGGVVFLALLGALAIVFLLVPEVSEQAPTTPAPVVTIPQPARQVPPEPEELSPTPEPDVFLREPVPGRDLDSDGLTDAEEQLFGSNPRLPDTDGDGFLDSNEVFHGYDPSLAAPATLLLSGRLTEFRRPTHPFVFLYPTPWNVTTDGDAILLRSQTGDRVRVESVSQIETPTLQEAITSVFPEETNLFAELDVSKTRLSFPLAVTKDHLRAFVLLPEGLVHLRYDVAEGKETVDYVQTLQAIAQSVEPASHPL